MSYEANEIKQGVKLHCIETDKFKTDLVSVFLTVPLDRKTITQNALIPAVLRMGTSNLKSQEEISIELEKMYGASFDCGIEKNGDNQVLKFFLETIDDEFLPNKEENIKKSIKLLLDIVFNPLTENNLFKDEYVVSEKENLKKIIKGKIDNKDRYAYNRCIEEMYNNKPYGLYKYGYVEDLDKIDNTNLYNQYKMLINTAKIDIFVSGNINKKEILDIITSNENINKLQPRNNPYIISKNEKNENTQSKPQVIEEKMDVTQGKLVIGTYVNFDDEKSKYKISLYSVILGEGATSKLFQNVREKESLAYTTRSNYIRQKNNIFIRCGIEVKNYEKAMSVIKEQLDDMEKGNFTEDDIENAKKYVIAGLNTTREEQDSEISYYFGQELLEKFTTLEEYEKEIKDVNREDIIKVANSIKIDTVYFLRN